MYEVVIINLPIGVPADSEPEPVMLVGRKMEYEEPMWIGVSRLLATVHQLVSPNVCAS